MATITKTFKENDQSSYQSTWTVAVTGTDQTVSGDFTLSLPTVTAKFVYSGKTKGTVRLGLNLSVGGAWAEYDRPTTGDYAAMTSGTNYSISRVSSAGTSIRLANVFNANNKTSKTVDVQLTSDTWGIFLRSSNADESMDRSYSNSSKYTWGKIATITLNAPPTFNATNATSDTNGFYAGISTARVTLSSCSAKYGGDITQTKLTIGNQTATGTGNGTLSIKLTTAGTFTPTVTVTDSRGQTTTKTLATITVNPYALPQVAIQKAERTTASGTPDDEGTAAVVTASFSYTEAITDLLQPTVSVGGEAQVAGFCSWYASRAVDGTLSDPVNWSSYHPGSPVMLYGYMAGPFSKEHSYIIGVTPEDEYNQGHEITQTLPQAYYTIDVYAGGHGIAFGAPATEDGFKVAMPAVFTDAVVLQPGVIQMFAGASAPAGWLLCRGQAISRTAYAALFAAIGTAYGAGDGSTTFNLPDLRDRFPVGAGSTYALNAKGGANTVTLTKEQSGLPAHGHGFTQPKIPNHTHGMGNLWSNGSGSETAYTMQSSRVRTTRNTTSSGGGGACTGGAVTSHAGANASQAHENRPPYIGINFIICTGRI